MVDRAIMAGIMTGGAGAVRNSVERMVDRICANEGLSRAEVCERLLAALERPVEPTVVCPICGGIGRVSCAGEEGKQ